MQAVVYTKLGPPEVLQLCEVATPVPKDNQVLVKVQAASANALDWRRFSAQLAGAGVPLATRVMDGMLLKTAGTVLGADIAGTVVATGMSARQFQPGDEVFGVAAGSTGGFAEYACAAEDALARKPSGLSFETAAAAPVAGLTALQALRKGGVRSGHKVLIYGASGGVGTFAVQIAKAFGAEVTAVGSPPKLELLRSIGADYVINYTQEDFTRSGRRYDSIIAINGQRSLADYRRVLAPAGSCIVVGGSMTQILQAMSLGPLLSAASRKKLGFLGISKVNQEDLLVLGNLMETAKVAAVIERLYPLKGVAEAMRYLAAGHANGKVVFVINHP